MGRKRASERKRKVSETWIQRKYKTTGLHSFLPNAYNNIARKFRQYGFTKKGFEFHHWDYHILNSVFQVSRKAHKCLHRHMIFNHQDLFCYEEDGTRLTSENKQKTILIQYFKKKDLKKG